MDMTTLTQAMLTGLHYRGEAFVREMPEVFGEMEIGGEAVAVRLVWRYGYGFHVQRVVRHADGSVSYKDANRKINPALVSVDEMTAAHLERAALWAKALTNAGGLTGRVSNGRGNLRSAHGSAAVVR